MSKLIGVIITIFLTLSGQAFSADSNVTIKPKWSDINPDAKECGGFSEDSLILTINISRKELIHEFCSSYGNADAKIIRDESGSNFLVLKFAQGRGTNATSEYLSVYKIEKHLEEYARILVSEPAGRLSHSYYDYKIEKRKSGGLMFVLSLRIEGDPKDAEWFPNEKKRIIEIQ